MHPNIVQIYEVGTDAGLPFFSLELVTGGTLEQKIASKPQPPREGAAIAPFPLRPGGVDAGQHIGADELVDEALRAEHAGEIVEEASGKVIHTAADGRRYLVVHGDEFDGIVTYDDRLAKAGRANGVAVISPT